MAGVMPASQPALLFGTSVYSLTEGLVLVGRTDPEAAHRPDIDLAPFDAEHLVSRRHAQLECRGGAVTVRDLGSSNGTFVDGEALPALVPRPLRDQQRVRFGHLTLLFAADVTGTEIARRATDPDTQVIEVSMMERLGELLADPGEVAGPPSRLVLERVQHVLDGEELAIVFQPVMGLRLRRVAGVEALSRIAVEPRRGPDVWFGEAFTVGLGVDLELAAIARALDGFARLPAGAYLAFNTSPETVLSDGFTTALDGRPLDRLVVEVTEHAAVADYRALHDALAPLREGGLRLAIDDMGSGYANMQHVLRLAPDIIKLDVALVRGIDRDRARRALAGSLAVFAEEMGARLVAEGIETPAELDCLVELGVPYGQGFELARPGPLPLPDGLLPG
jgi:EAL domain-containing protein (putative c-di-GMP-specific phosphodiesterase class I)